MYIRAVLLLILSLNLLHSANLTGYLKINDIPETAGHIPQLIRELGFDSATRMQILLTIGIAGHPHYSSLKDKAVTAFIQEPSPQARPQLIFSGQIHDNCALQKLITLRNWHIHQADNLQFVCLAPEHLNNIETLSDIANREQSHHIQLEYKGSGWKYVQLQEAMRHIQQIILSLRLEQDNIHVQCSIKGVNALHALKTQWPDFPYYDAFRVSDDGVLRANLSIPRTELSSLRRLFTN